MLMLLCVCFVLISVIPLQATESITPIAGMDELRQHIECAVQDTLVVFDVDNVILIPSAPAWQMPNMVQHKVIFRRCFGELSEDEQDAFLNLIVLHYPSLLLEQDAPQIIDDLKKRGLRSVALTSVWNGQTALRGNFEHYRYDVLKGFGIDFSSSFPDVEYVSFKDFPMVRDSHPSYYKGILFANGLAIDKGEVLLKFFDAVKWTPKCVIFVDDTKRHLENAEKALLPLGIKFIGLEYRAAKTYPASPIDAVSFERQCQQLAEEARSMVHSELAPSGRPLL